MATALTGLIEKSATAFSNLWKVNSDCRDATPDINLDPCVAHPQRGLCIICKIYYTEYFSNLNFIKLCWLFGYKPIWLEQPAKVAKRASIMVGTVK